MVVLQRTDAKFCAANSVDAAFADLRKYSHAQKIACRPHLTLQTVTVIPSLQEDDMNKAKKYANKALDIYRQVLQKSEGNIYAANGIGAALAELGDYTTAQKIFMMVGYHSPLTRACSDANSTCRAR